MRYATLQLLWVAAGLTVGLTNAQAPFDAPYRAFDVATRSIVAESNLCIAAADVTGDGYPDVVVGRRGGRPPGLTPGIPGILVLANEGPRRDAPATLARVAFYPTQRDPQDLALVDLDGDGALEVLLAGHDRQLLAIRPPRNDRR